MQFNKRLVLSCFYYSVLQKNKPMKKILIILGIIGILNAQAQCCYHTTYPSPAGWKTDGGTYIIGTSSFNFNNTPCNASGNTAFSYATHPLACTLSDSAWKGDVDFEYTGRGSGGVAHSLLAIIADTLNAWNTPSFAETNQNAIETYINSPFGGAQNTDSLYAHSKVGATWNAVSKGIALPSMEVTYYIRLERVSSTLGRISLFLDPARIVHAPGSPQTFPVTSAVTGLSYVQHGAIPQGNYERALTATLKNLDVCDSIATYNPQPGSSSGNPILVNYVTPPNNSFSGTTALNTIWFSFTAQKTTTDFSIINSNINKNDDYNVINVYGGTNNNLHVITSYTAPTNGSGDSLYTALATNLIVGQSYYIQLTRKITSSDLSTLSMRVFPYQSVQSSGGDDQTFCFKAIGPFTDPPIFTMDNCSNPDGADCIYGTTYLKIFCIDNGGVPNDLTFDVTVSGGGCSSQINASNVGTSANTSLYSSSNCPGSGPYNIAITGISYSGPIATTLKFSFTIETDYTCDPNNFSGDASPDCSDVEVDFVFNDAQIVNSMGISTQAFTSCAGQQVVIKITGLDGDDLTNNYTFDWSNQLTGASLGGGNPFSTSTAGTFQVAINTANQNYDNPGLCNETIQNITVTNLPAPTVQITSPSPQTICSGSSATINSVGSGGGGTYHYQWSDGSNSTSQDITVSPTTTTTYDVTATDQFGCASSVASSVVDVNAAPSFSISGPTGPVCPGTSVNLTASGTGYTYLWSGPSGFSSTSASINVSPGTGNTVYTCVATNPTTHCISTQHFTIAVPTGFTPATINVPYAFQCEAINNVETFYSNVTGTWSLVQPSGSNAFIQSYNNGSENYASVNFTGVNGNVTLVLTGSSDGCPTSTSIVLKECCTAARNINHHFNFNLGTLTDPNHPGQTYLTNQNYTNSSSTDVYTYVVTGQLVFIGNTTLNNVNFEMNPGSSIVVDGGGTLNITNSHIYACSDMWQGISFNTLYSLTGSGDPQTPNLIINNSLIEDAIYGVNIAYGNIPSSNYQSELLANGQAAQPVVTLNNAWFNRCAAGIISDYDPLHPDSMIALNSTVPYSNYSTNHLFNSGVITATNCVFSCLSGITMARVTAANPNYNTNGLAGDYLHNYMYTPNFYSFCGIAANGSSFGASNTINSCYFDNLVDGIVSYDNPYNFYTSSFATDYYTPATSNLNVTSCSFNRMELVSPSPNYNFIINNAYAVNDMYGPTGGAFYYPYSQFFGGSGTNPVGSVGAGINFFGSQLNVGGNSTTGCKFTNSNYGVIAKPDGESPVNITYNTFSGTTISGVYMNDVNYQSASAQSIAVTNNTFKDHFQLGINLIFLENGDMNSISASYNNFTISAAFNSSFVPFWQQPTNFSYAPQAISVASFGLANPFYGSMYDAFSISGNTIHGYEKGIQGQSAYYTSISRNTIDGMPNDQNNPTFGISLTNCDYSYVILNTVKAPNTSTAAWMYSQDGIVTVNCANSQILCNTIDGPDVSMYCGGPNNVSSIEGNAFKNAQPFNFWLDNYGYVGQQGSASLGTGNTFSRENTYTWTDALFAGNNTNGTLSPFYYVSSVVNQHAFPSSHDGTSSPIADYTVLGHLRGNFFNCSGLRLATAILNPVTAQSIAQDSIQFSGNNATAVYGNQHDLYRALVDTGSAFYTANPVLNSFMLSMVGSSHEKLLVTDTLLANAGTDSSIINQALAINNSFIPTGKHDAYLQKINNLYAAYKKAKKHMNASQVQDVKSIALLCPYEYGEGVYKARALLKWKYKS